MRIVFASVTFLTMAVYPAAASEAFITQLTSKAATAAQTAEASTKALLSSATLAFPLKLNPISLPAQPSAAAGTNSSTITQIGTNNFAAVTQTGGGNASAIVQRGSGNQAVVMQRH
jgi:hypothetical protein